MVHSVAHFYLYDAGALDPAMRAAIAPLLDSGVVSITDLRSTLLFSIKMWGQARNDLLFYALQLPPTASFCPFPSYFAFFCLSVPFHASLCPLHTKLLAVQFCFCVFWFESIRLSLPL